MSADILSFDTGLPTDSPANDETLVVDVEGYEGPLDLLLALARQQKVDLHKISILALADQYLVFIEQARKIRLELAADYLVMAAWLAFLKSRLLLPEPATPDGPSAEEMATALAARLRRLEAIREAANRLMTRPQLQRDIFPRGLPERISEVRHPRFTATLYDLLSAYATQRQSRVLASCTWRAAPSGRSPRPAHRWSGLSVSLRTGACSTIIFWLTWSTRRSAPQSWHRASRLRSNWCAKVRWTSVRKRRSRHCISASTLPASRWPRTCLRASQGVHPCPVLRKSAWSRSRIISRKPVCGRNCCGCWKPCCSLRPNRSTRRRSQSGCRTASM